MVYNNYFLLLEEIMHIIIVGAAKLDALSQNSFRKKKLT